MGADHLTCVALGAIAAKNFVIIDSLDEVSAQLKKSYPLTLLNELMKVLAVFATICIQLTFVAGVYGMNYEYMPELTFKWGHPTI